jgi:hypothetical protein
MAKRKWTRVDTRVEPNKANVTADVTITPDGSPFQYVLQMDEHPEHGVICVGIGITQPVGPDRQPITGPVARELVDRFDQLERAAYGAISWMRDNGETVTPPPRTRRELSDEFLADVARRHNEYRTKGLPPTQTLARAERVSDGTVKHWLRKARERGIEKES